MKINGFVVVGIVVVAVGWLWLAAGSSVDTGRFDRVFNLQLASMAQQLIGFGYTLLVVGTLVSGFRWLKPEIVSHNQISTDDRNASPLRDFAKAVGPKASSEPAAADSAVPINAAELQARLDAMKSKTAV